MPNKEIPQNKVILRLPAVMKKTSLSRSTIYRLSNEGKFPSRVILSVNAIGFYEHEIEEFLASRPRFGRPIGGAK